MKAVINSSPLIALAIIGHLELLRSRFDQVIVPTSVYAEITEQGIQRPGVYQVKQIDWLSIRTPSSTPSWSPQLLGLGPGERDVLLLAQEFNIDWVIIDERLGQRIAAAMNLPLKGTLGILLAAYQTGLLAKADALHAVDLLAVSAIRVSPRLVSWFQAQLELK